ncbi:NHL repeat-containing protein [Hymenobacter lapidiphilus]|uniref:SMP-30/Gluconolactonase/LRE-like region domain-containing protein n=1 Tax=Hymenobacter lapidiphilus TaxID=2608003 RepID=A0A7Y7PR77_9BACT|nr:NHL repeat-containing protein [Hymenobacter lapidiphilus]NVO32359.1 hypothetical protein [Hymenobacter lapidiphilus]
MLKKHRYLLCLSLGLPACHSSAPSPGIVVSTVAGQSKAGFAEGPPTTALFNRPLGVAVDAQGNLYVADTENRRIRKITPDGFATTVAGSGGAALVDGPAATAAFNGPRGVAVDADGTLYVADTGNHCIRQVKAGVVTTLAGTVHPALGGLHGFADGPAAAARFSSPYGVAVDAQHNVYVADTENHRIRKISGGVVSTLAGNGKNGFADGPGATAQFFWPGGVAVDGAGAVYVADYGTHRLRKVAPAGTVSTVAGSGTTGTADGVGAAAQLALPEAVAVDGHGTVFLTDGSARVRQITAGGAVSTLAGSGVRGYADGLAAAAQFQRPAGLAVDAQGCVYVADGQDHRIRKIATP